MHYKKSENIFREIKNAKKILLNCHRGPDLDSVGSALSMNYVLKSLGKVTEVVCHSDKIYDDLKYLEGYENINKGVDFGTFDYSKFDLFICLDSSSWSMVTGEENVVFPEIPIINIDHHFTNEKYGELNLVDAKRSSVGELLFLLFEDWKIDINKVLATSLLTALIGDTGIFKYPNTTNTTFNVACKLINLGAEKNLIIEKAYRSYDFRLVKFCGEVLSNLKIDDKYKFVYSFISYDMYEKWGKPENAKEVAVDLFAQVIKNTNFGLLGLEREKGKLSISFRAREGFDTSSVARLLNGGGHKAASGGKVEGLEFTDAVNKTLKVIRDFLKKK